MTAVQQSPAWSVLAAVAIVLAAAVLAGCLDAVLDPRGPASPGSRVLRPVREAARSLLSQRRSTTVSDRLLWGVGVLTPLLVAVLMAPVIPLGTAAVTDLSVGLVWFNAMDVILWAGWWLAGWGPNSVYSLAGGYRFLAQALAYELPLMFALTAPAVAAGSLSVPQIVAAQQARWFIVEMPLAAVVFTGSVAAFAAWGPFGHPTGQDIADGLLVEQSGPDRLLLRWGQYALLVVGSAMTVALFLGGGAGPLLPPWLWTVVKSAAVLTVLLLLRHRFPACRPDRLMRLAWLVVLPLVLLQLLAVSVLAVAGGAS